MKVYIVCVFGAEITMASVDGSESHPMLPREFELLRAALEPYVVAKELEVNSGLMGASMLAVVTDDAILPYWGGGDYEQATYLLTAEAQEAIRNW